MLRYPWWLLLLAINVCQAQTPQVGQQKLTLDRIFASSEFALERLPSLKWRTGGEYTKLTPSTTRPGGNDIVLVRADGINEVLVGADKLVTQLGKQPLAIQGYEFSKDLDLLLIYTNSVKVWRQNTRGDYWTYRRSTGKLSQLGKSFKPSTLMFAKLSPDGTRVGYVCENNLYVESADSGQPLALTKDGSDQIINGTFDWVYEEEFSCRDGWRWSPDGQKISYWQLNTQGVPVFTMMDNTTAKYPILKTFAYPKTGEQNSACRIGVVPATGGATTWMNIPGDTRHDYYLPRMEWTDQATELVIQRVNRLQNQVDVVFANVQSGQARPTFTDRDDAWIDLSDESMQWLEGGKAFTWISERDGWRKLYIVSRDGQQCRCVIPGKLDMIDLVRIDEKAGQVYFIASPENPTQRYLYRCNLDGTGQAERLTPQNQPGWHDYSFAPGRAEATHTYSVFGQPPTIDLVTLPEHRVIRTVVSNEKVRDTLAKLEPNPTEFFRVDIGNGVVLDGWMIKPTGFDPQKKYPLVFHVYGEPAGQTVVDRWGGNNYLWHRMLAQQGYVVACLDNRGTPCPRGREWRKSVYRKIGTLASQDQAAAARKLLGERAYLDPKRVAVWGWSGGGSMTLNLLFRHPELYHTGMSVAPVPDMQHYDTIYQERYMGLPQQNLTDYIQGSPITHAAGLQGNLLVVHGTGDDNCHYQGVEKLANKLIELNKPFTMMPYPNRSHSINEGKNTSRHLYSLLTHFLNENLEPGAR